MDCWAAMKSKNLGRLRRFVLVPFGFALLGGLLMLGGALFDSLTGFRGGGQPQASPIPLSEAWPDAWLLARLVFVVTLLVLLVWTWIRGKDPHGE